MAGLGCCLGHRCGTASTAMHCRVRVVLSLALTRLLASLALVGVRMRVRRPFQGSLARSRSRSLLRDKARSRDRRDGASSACGERTSVSNVQPGIRNLSFFPWLSFDHSLCPCFCYACWPVAVVKRGPLLKQEKRRYRRYSKSAFAG
jgi:hypothetical protein